MGGGRRGEAPVSRELGGLEFAHCSASCTIQVGSGSGVISNCAHPERGCKHLLASQTLGTTFFPQGS